MWSCGSTGKNTILHLTCYFPEMLLTQNTVREPETVCAAAQSCCLPAQEAFCCFCGSAVTGTMYTEQGDGLAQDKSAPCQQCLSLPYRPGQFCFTLSDTAAQHVWMYHRERDVQRALMWSSPIPHTKAHYTRTKGRVFNISKISIIPPNWYPYLLNWSISSPTPIYERNV